LTANQKLGYFDLTTLTLVTTVTLQFLLWTRFHPILHIKEALDCFRLDLLLLLLVLLVLLLVLLLCVCV